jgi:hypothetical protein
VTCFSTKLFCNKSQKLEKGSKTFFIPLQAELVSKANLRSEQGGINFTPFVLSLPYANQFWPTIFVQFFQKIYFYKDKFTLQSVILAEF